MIFGSRERLPLDSSPLPPCPGAPGGHAAPLHLLLSYPYHLQLLSGRADMALETGSYQQRNCCLRQDHPCVGSYPLLTSPPDCAQSPGGEFRTNGGVMSRLKAVAEYHGQRSLSGPISSVIRQASSKLSGSCLVPQGQ